MNKEWKITTGSPYPLGSYVEYSNYRSKCEMTVNFAVIMNSRINPGIKFYNKKTGKSSIFHFKEEHRIGNIYSIKITGIDIGMYDYNFLEDSREFCDPYGKIIYGNEVWGKAPKKLRTGILLENASPECHTEKIPYDDSVFYLLHVRGFTKSKSSEVRHPGTFGGTAEKIPYLKNLGITSVILMPAYEFFEMEQSKHDKASVLNKYIINEPKLNFWGFKQGYYFAPKHSYTEPGMSPVESFRNMVRAFHNNNMEVILQFYFDGSIKPNIIPDVLKFWVREYNVDGFYLCGNSIPMKLLGSEPLLTETKLIYNYIDDNDIYGGSRPEFKNLAVCNDEYMYTMRRFLKGDEGQLKSVIDYLKWENERVAGIHYMTNYNGFTLMDLVSYDRKHNEANGENNNDGDTYNASWNCGAEGTTGRKAVKKLRRKQIRNAILLNCLGQSTPLIRGGDEMGNSQRGNNNPYCIDSFITWLEWNNLEKNKDIFDFLKKALEFRKNNRILSTDRVYKHSDYHSITYPDLSYHGEEAWKLDLDYLMRHFALLYACDYAYDMKPGDESHGLIYIAMNMHWCCHEFALPLPMEGRSWKLVFDTAREDEIFCEEKWDGSEENKIMVKDRSIVVLKS